MIFKNLLLVTHSRLLPAWLTPAQANMTISQSDSEASASPAEKYSSAYRPAERK